MDPRARNELILANENTTHNTEWVVVDWTSKSYCLPKIQLWQSCRKYNMTKWSSSLLIFFLWFAASLFATHTLLRRRKHHKPRSPTCVPPRNTSQCLPKSYPASGVCASLNMAFTTSVHASSSASPTASAMSNINCVICKTWRNFRERRRNRHPSSREDGNKCDLPQPRWEGQFTFALWFEWLKYIHPAPHCQIGYPLYLFI